MRALFIFANALLFFFFWRIIYYFPLIKIVKKKLLQVQSILQLQDIFSPIFIERKLVSEAVTSCLYQFEYSNLCKEATALLFLSLTLFFFLNDNIGVINSLIYLIRRNNNWKLFYVLGKLKPIPSMGFCCSGFKFDIMVKYWPISHDIKFKFFLFFSFSF